MTLNGGEGSFEDNVRAALPTDADLKQVAIESLIQRERERGFLTGADYAAAGKFVNRSQRQVQRWMREDRVASGTKTRDRHRERFELTDLMISAVYANAGNLRAAYAQLCEAQILTCCSETSFRNAWARLPVAIQRYPTIGREAIRTYGLYPAWTAPVPNDVWQLDSHDIDLFCRFGGDVIRPVVTDIIDDCSRLIVGSILTPDAPRASDIAAVAAMALRTREAPDGTVIGGAPRLVLYDCALAHSAELIARGWSQLGIVPRSTQPYEPTQKGKKERHYRTLEAECFRELPGYITPNALTKEGEYLYRPHTSELLTYEQVLKRLLEYTNYYNFERPHQGIGGRRPIDVVRAHAVTPRTIDRAVLARAFWRTKRETYTVQKRGVHVERYYSSWALIEHVGKKVIVRYDPTDPDFIAVNRTGFRGVSVSMTEDVTHGNSSEVPTGAS
ncbi:MAG TPA: Mu transposase C-terminal domain-containing protein [Candidatus Limnocylindrales bacterium]|nr:Mu transposase C-terminal domain-containing protein [Candidatus Limnocylindrales bacterium]